MVKYIDLACACCGSCFQRLFRDYNREVKRRKGKAYSPLCSFDCKQRFRLKKVEVLCDQCNIITKKSLKDLKRNKHNFCSQSCSALFNNSLRSNSGFTLKGKKKDISCTKCGDIVEAGLNAPISNFTCKNCRHSAKLQEKQCVICNIQIVGTYKKKYCDSCRRDKMSTQAIARVMSDENSLRLKSIRCKYPFNGVMIRCDSKVEYSALNYIETNYEILHIKRCSLVLPYKIGNEKHNYNPDFDVKLKSGKQLIVECKAIISNKDLQRKWKQYYLSIPYKEEVLKLFCKQNNYDYLYYHKDMNRKYYDSLTRDMLIKEKP